MPASSGTAPLARGVPPGRIVAALSLAPLLRLAVDVALGFGHLMRARLADDAFYYYEISRHLPFFNDGVATSGFHPLLAVLVAPWHRWLAPEPAVVVSLAILVLAQGAGTWLVWRLVRRSLGVMPGLVGAGAWAVSGQLYAIAATGVETVLAAVLVLAAWDACPPEPWGERRRRPFVAFSVLLTLAFFARLDAPLLLAPAAGVLGVGLLRQRRRGLAAVVAAIPVAGVVAWLASMHHLTGEWAPSSSAALRLLWGVDGAVITDPGRLAASSRHLLEATLDFFVAAPWQSWLVDRLVALLLAGLVARTAWRLVRARAWREFPAVRLLGLICAGVLVWALYYVLHHGGFRFWYFAHVAVLAFAVLLPLAVRAVPWLSRNDPRALAVGLSVVALVALASPPVDFAPQEYDKYRSARCLDRVLRERSVTGRVGAFNAGVYDYFSDTDVINLDGVVNPPARRALAAGRLPAFLAEHGITHLIEHDLGQAAGLARLQQAPGVRLEKVFDFRRCYEPHGGVYAKDTFLWRVHHQ
jgi:hypothetical protein